MSKQKANKAVYWLGTHHPLQAHLLQNEYDIICPHHFNDWPREDVNRQVLFECDYWQTQYEQLLFVTTAAYEEQAMKLAAKQAKIRVIIIGATLALVNGRYIPKADVALITAADLAHLASERMTVMREWEEAINVFLHIPSKTS